MSRRSSRKTKARDFLQPTESPRVVTSTGKRRKKKPAPPAIPVPHFNCKGARDVRNYAKERTKMLTDVIEKQRQKVGVN